MGRCGGLLSDFRHPQLEQFVTRVAENPAGEFVDGDVAHVVAGDEDEGGACVDRLAEEGGLDEGLCSRHDGPDLRIGA